MAIRVAIKHKTIYHYDRFVALTPHIFRLRPAVHSRTAIESYSFQITPKNHFINWQQDPFGNFQARVVFPERTNMLVVDVEVIARLEVINPFDFFVEEYAQFFPFQYSSHLKGELVPFLEIKESGPMLSGWVARLNKNKKNINDFLVYINQKLNRDIAYSIRMEPRCTILRRNH